MLLNFYIKKKQNPVFIVFQNADKKHTGDNYSCEILFDCNIITQETLQRCTFSMTKRKLTLKALRDEKDT